MSKNSRARHNSSKDKRYRWHLLNEVLEKRKLKLVERLGGKCISCGEDDPKKLDFHHNQGGKTWRSNQLSRTERIRRYEQDASHGLIDLLCYACHDNYNDHPDSCFCEQCRGEPDF